MMFRWAIAGSPPEGKWPVHYTLEEVTISNSMNFGVQKAHGGKKKVCFWLAGHENLFTLQIFMKFSCSRVGLGKQLALYIGLSWM
jgi:hypothetical protein